MAFGGAHALAMLEAVTPHNAQNEYYLTDLVEIAAARGLAARAIQADEVEAMGVNDRVQLAAAEAAMQARLRRRAMVEGATLIAPETVFLSFDTKIGRDVLIEPHVVIGPGVTHRGRRDHPRLLASRRRAGGKRRVGRPLCAA